MSKLNRALIAVAAMVALAAASLIGGMGANAKTAPEQWGEIAPGSYGWIGPVYPDPTPTGTAADWAWTAPFVVWRGSGDLSTTDPGNPYDHIVAGSREDPAATRIDTECLNVDYPYRAGQSGAELAARSDATVWLFPDELPSVSAAGPVVWIYKTFYGSPASLAGKSITVDLLDSVCAATWNLAGPAYVDRANSSTGVSAVTGTTDPITVRANALGQVIFDGFVADYSVMGSWPTFGNAGARGWALTADGTQVPFRVTVHLVDNRRTQPANLQYVVDQGDTLTIDQEDVLAVAAFYGDKSTLSIVSGSDLPAGVMEGANPTWTYTAIDPSPVTFKYRLQEPINGLSDSASVTINVLPYGSEAPPYLPPTEEDPPTVEDPPLPFRADTGVELASQSPATPIILLALAVLLAASAAVLNRRRVAKSSE